MDLRRIAKGIERSVVHPHVDGRALVIAQVVAQQRRPGSELKPAQPQLALVVVAQIGLNVPGDLGVPVRKAAQSERQGGRHHGLQPVRAMPAHDRVAVPLGALVTLRADGSRAQQEGEVAVRASQRCRVPRRPRVQQRIAIVALLPARAVGEGRIGRDQLTQIQHAAVVAQVIEGAPPRGSPPQDGVRVRVVEPGHLKSRMHVHSPVLAFDQEPVRCRLGVIAPIEMEVGGEVVQYFEAESVECVGECPGVRVRTGLTAGKRHGWPAQVGFGVDGVESKDR